MTRQRNEPPASAAWERSSFILTALYGICLRCGSAFSDDYVSIKPTDVSSVKAGETLMTVV